MKMGSGLGILVLMKAFADDILQSWQGSQGFIFQGRFIT